MAVDSAIWAEEVERLRGGSPARMAAETERRGLEADGVPRTVILGCEAAGSDGTALPGHVKVYVPSKDAPPSQRPWAFVFQVGAGGVLELVAFGERHPKLPATRSVYERAHKRLHGRYPDQ